MEFKERQRLFGMLGFAMRAGKTVVGTDLVCRAMPSSKVKLVIVSAGASDSTKKKLTTKCEFYGICHLVAELEPEELAKTVGKSFAAATVAITDDRFAKEILKLFE